MRGSSSKKKKKKVTYCFLKKITGAAAWAVMKSEQVTMSRGCCKNTEGVEGELEEGRGVDGYRTGLGGVGHESQSSLGSRRDGQKGDAQTV